MTEVRPEYVDALGASVVKVVAGPARGTAFIVSRCLALTCLHVVQNVRRRPRPDAGWPEDDEGDLQVVDHRGRSIAAWVRRNWPAEPASVGQGLQPWPDLALLDLGEPAAGLPAVLLDVATPGQGNPVVMAGYPVKDAVSYQARRYAAGYTANRDEEGKRYLSLTEEAVDHGFSGGPVLSSEGFVVAYVRLKRGTGTDAPGGFAVLLSDVLPVAEELRPVFDNPGPSARAWVDVLGNARLLKSHGRDPEGRRFQPFGQPSGDIDIELLRDVSSIPPTRGWVLSTVAEPRQAYKRSVADLGEEVLEAVAQWSRRHSVNSARQVAVVSTVLSRLLLPPEVVSVVQQRIRGAGDVPVVRLRVEPDDALGRIPWEFASSPDPEGGADIQLAADTRLIFSRYVDRPPTDTSIPPELRILVVVNALSERSKRIAESLEALFPPSGSEARGFQVSVVLDQSFHELQQALKDGPWPVVHYVGTEHATNMLTFRGYSGLQPSGVQLSVLAESLRRACCRLLVLQLQDRRSASPQGESDTDWLSLLQGSIQALMLAEHATSIDHVLSLASRVYDELANGRTVEHAGQLYRNQIASQPPMQSDPEDSGVGELLDVAAFGSVSVTTTRAGHVRLAEPVRRDTDEHAGKDDHTSLRPAGPAEQPVSAPAPAPASSSSPTWFGR